MILVQNRAARIVTRTPIREHITPILRELHWLPIRERITFKILLLAYKTRNATAPRYMSELLPVYTPLRSLRSEGLGLITTPRYRLEMYGKKTFSVQASRLWNQLDNNIKTSESVTILTDSIAAPVNRKLKRALYKQRCLP